MLTSVHLSNKADLSGDICVDVDRWMTAAVVEWTLIGQHALRELTEWIRFNVKLFGGVVVCFLPSLRISARDVSI